MSIPAGLGPSAELAEALKLARRRIHQVQIRDALRAGAGTALTALLAIGVLAFTWSALVAVGLVSHSWNWTGLWIVSAGLVLLAIGWHVVRAAMNRLPLAQVAQRLDLAAGTHNRIATALELVEFSAGDAISLAAIADGVAIAIASAKHSPAVEPSNSQWKRNIAKAAVGVALLVGAISLPRWARNLQKPEDGGEGPVRVALADSNVFSPAIQPKPIAPKPQETHAAASTPTDQTTATTGEARNPARNSQTSAQASGKSAGRGQFSVGDSGGAGPQSQAQASKASPKPTGTRRPESPTARPQENSQAASASASSVGNGQSGGGGKQSAENSWDQRDSSEGDSTDGSDEAKDPSEPNPGNTHRGGLQPMLQDRNQAPSRDLSLGAVGTAGGNGRGGPTPPKKSRGTGAMLMAVPMPDFVAAALLPGPSKVVFVNGEPRRVDHAPLTSAQAAARSIPEPQVPRVDVPIEQAGLIDRYLTQLHRDEDAPSESGPVRAINQ